MNTSDILWFDQLGIHDRPLAGGKGASLGEMTRAGLPIPAGCVVTTAAFTAFIDALEQEFPVRSSIARLRADDLDTIRLVTAQIRTAIQQRPMPAELEQHITAACARLGAVPLAVRSSATSEDSQEASFAGLQDTYLWLKGVEQVLARVRDCWASLYSAESVSYRLRLNVSEATLAMAVVVQTMVNSRSAGVMFTRSPTTGDRSVITIESSWGLGSALVSGEVTPDRFVVNKVTQEIRTRVVACKHMAHIPDEQGGVVEQPLDDEHANRSSVSDAEILQLGKLGRAIEQHYGTAQDIEWAIDQSGAIKLLQSRPETVWSGKNAAPAAKPAAKPFDHIFSLLGGQGKA